MSKPRYGWWSYAKYMCRKYPEHKAALVALRVPSTAAAITGTPGGSSPGRPTEQAALKELPPQQMRELEAVEAAIKDTMALPTGVERMELVDRVLFRKTHTLEGAALMGHISLPTAKRYHRDFIRSVGENYGFCLKDDPQEPKKHDILIS